MKLFLTSSGITNPTLGRALLHLLNKPAKESCMTFIPTAANAEKGGKTWVDTDINNVKNLGFATWEVIDISAVPKYRWEESFKQADLLVFGGGNLTYLLDCLRSSGVGEALPELLKTKVYMGISAGSMAAAKTVSLSSTNLLYYEQTGSLKFEKGLGFVDFEIRPHLNSSDFPKVTLEHLETLEKNIPYAFYAIDDNTALQIVDGMVTVVSEGVWKKFN